jgi:nitrogenase iron protein NifH
VPRDNIVQHAEINKKTVIEFNAEAEQADVYRDLARRVDENDMFVVPKPLPMDGLESMMMEFGIIDA